MDRQQHVELLRLAIDNPELIEVLGGEPAGPHSRHEIYANLAMMCWPAIWELGEVDDDSPRPKRPPAGGQPRVAHAARPHPCSWVHSRWPGSAGAYATGVAVRAAAAARSGCRR